MTTDVSYITVFLDKSVFSSWMFTTAISARSCQDKNFQLSSIRRAGCCRCSSSTSCKGSFTRYYCMPL